MLAVAEAGWYAIASAAVARSWKRSLPQLLLLPCLLLVGCLRGRQGSPQPRWAAHRCCGQGTRFACGFRNPSAAMAWVVAVVGVVAVYMAVVVAVYMVAVVAAAVLLRLLVVVVVVVLVREGLSSWLVPLL